MSAQNLTTGSSSKNLMTVVGFLLLVIGVVAAIYTVSKPQDVREQAQVVPSNQPSSCTVVFSVPSPTPSNTPTPSPTPSRTPTPSPTPSNTPTPTPTPSRTPSPTPSNTPSPTPSLTPTPTPTRTPSPLPTPSNTPTPVPTATPLLLCLSIQVSPPSPTLGQSVTLTCGNVIGAYRYEFRMSLPDGSLISLAPTSLQSNISQPYTIVQSGPHGAQCRLCMGPDAASCQSWEQQ